MSNLIENNDVNTLGFLSALIATMMTCIFALSLFASFWVQTDMVSFVACFILAPFFVIMIVCLHYSTPIEKKVWSNIGIVFAVIYAVCILMTYYIQLAVVMNNPRSFSTDILEPFIYSNVGSVMFSIDMLGYAFMALSTLLTAAVFAKKSKLENWIKRFFILHGLLFIPTLLFPLLPLPQEVITPSGSDNFGSIVLIIWCCIFAPLAGLVGVYFKQKKNTNELNH